jgi:RNA polymerase sigma factor (sigma-70 family)
MGMSNSGEMRLAAVVADSKPSANDDFSRFYAAHEPALRSYLRGHVIDDTIAAEICGDVFSLAFREFATVRDLTNIRARQWLFNVARNKSLHAFRTEYRHRRIVDRARLQPMSDEAPVEDYVTAALERSELVARVHVIFAELPRDHRQILQMNALGRMSGQDIALALRITPTAARLRLMRAKRAFALAYTDRFESTTPSL